jgi:CIC family chloride channel protein
MSSSGFYTFQAPQWLRAFVRAHEASLIALAAVIGALAGLVVIVMSSLVELMHEILFGIGHGDRLSSQIKVDPLQALVVPATGGLALGFALLLISRWRSREVDPIEANALHGGMMSFRGSVIIALQTIWSSGVGGSVGLEAGYTQLGSGVASALGRGFNLRRSDQRIMVGCGAAGAIAGAFGAPLAGAFYAFELIIGAYTPVSLTPVGVAAVMGYLVTRPFVSFKLDVISGTLGQIQAHDLAVAVALGVAAAAFGIGIMRGVAMCEWLLTKSRLWMPLRPAIGGLVVGTLALITPQVLSSGHGALELTNLVQISFASLATIFFLKALASIVSLGTGFRGGLFFASLLLGALGGRLFALGVDAAVPSLSLNPNVYAVAGMSALSVSVVGGPLTMIFIALETTADLWLTTAVMIAVIISTQITRNVFGYSFATWRFHLRGETIRSAADVGWMRDLTVGRLMRQDPPTVFGDTSLEDFRSQYPLGSATQVVAVDGDKRYLGIVVVSQAHEVDQQSAKTLSDFFRYKDSVLLTAMNIREAVIAFDKAEAEALAVIDSQTSRRVVGLLTEAHALRRYSEESERKRREILGEE